MKVTTWASRFVRTGALGLVLAAAAAIGCDGGSEPDQPAPGAPIPAERLPPGGLAALNGTTGSNDGTPGNGIRCVGYTNGYGTPCTMCSTTTDDVHRCVVIECGDGWIGSSCY